MPQPHLPVVVRRAAVCFILALISLMFVATTAHAQEPAPPAADTAFDPASPDAISFTSVVTPLVTGGVGTSDVAWGDYDNDGYLDQLVNGCTLDNDFPPACVIPFHRVYHNDAGIGFSLAYTLPLDFVPNSKGAWGDYNNDGKLDILLDGWSGPNAALLVFQNTGNGFSQVRAIAGLNAASLAWGDYDNDGRLDFAVGGSLFGAPGIWVYRNSGPNFSFTRALTVTTGDASSSLAWGDYNNDGRLDLLATTDGLGGAAGVYRNTGIAFTREFTLPTQLANGAVAWGDYDNDGRLDFVAAGQASGVPQTQIFQNTVAGFVPTFALTGHSNGSVAWGDYDNDNRLDLLVTGLDAANLPATTVFRNTGAGFSARPFGLAKVGNGEGAWGDFDNDGRLDVLLTGCNQNCGSPVSVVYKNNGSTADTPPAAPTNLRSTVTANQVILQWDAPISAQAAVDGLSYNLYVTPTNGITYTLAPMANVTTGFRRIPALGNAQLGLTASLVLTKGTYLWSVQAVDGAWAGGAWQPGAAQFTVGGNCATNTNDSGAGSLRKAVADAPSGSIVCFDGSMAGKTIVLDSPITPTTDITITASVPVTISGGAKTRILQISAGRKVALVGLTLRDGYVTGDGGAILNAGTLSIEQSAILSNSVAGGTGGGIANTGQLVIRNSTLAYNSSQQNAKIALGASQPLRIAGMIGIGAAIVVGLAWPGKRRQRTWARGLALILAMALGPLGCFPVQQVAGGGAISSLAGSTNISFSTLAYNSAQSNGGAIFVDLSSNVSLQGSVLTQNTGGSLSTCGGKPVTSLGQNVASDGTCALGAANDFNQAGPQVGAIQSNGTAPLLSTSLAVGNGPTGCPATDQLGQPRSTPCDSGAVKFTGAPAALLKAELRASVDRAYRNDLVTFMAFVQNAGPVTAANLSISLPLPAGLVSNGTPTWTPGFNCSWLAPKLSCSTPLGRTGELAVSVPAKVNTADQTSLAILATAEATGATPATSGFRLSVLGAQPPAPIIVAPGQSIQLAVNRAAPGQTILLASGTYTDHDITISNTVTILGTGPNLTTIDAGGKNRGFIITRGAKAVISGLTLQNAGPDLDAGKHLGGAITNRGELVLSNCNLSRNMAFQVGTAITNDGVLTVTQCVISDNGTAGGLYIIGVYNAKGGVAAIRQSTLNADFNGIWNDGALTLSDSTMSGNTGWYGAFVNYGVATINHTTVSGNKTFSAAIINLKQLTVTNSIITQNGISVPPGSGIKNNSGSLAVSNSLVQSGDPVGSGTDNKFGVDPLFVSSPGAAGDSDFGNLHLKAQSPATGWPPICTGDDRDGTRRRAPTCSAGAYEYSAAKASVLAEVAIDATGAAAGALTTFTNTQGIVKLDIPAGAVTQTVQLAFSLGQITGGDGRAQSVVFSPYDDAGHALPADLGFAKAIIVTLGYDPALITHGLAIDLLPMRFEPVAGTWVPFTGNVANDTVNHTITFAMVQAGEYGLFAKPPAPYASIGAVSPTGVQNLGAGALVTYTLVTFNREAQPLTNLVLNHTLPAGVTFAGWGEANGATLNGNTITWNIPTLAGGGMRSATFGATVSGDAQFWGQPITSTVALAGPGNVSATGQAIITVNGPTTPVTDTVTTPPNTPVTLWPLANDINPDVSPLLLTAVGTPGHGTANIAGDTVIYTPANGFEGIDAFPYTVKDGQFTANGVIFVRVAHYAQLAPVKTVASGDREGVLIENVPPYSTVIYRLGLFNISDTEVANNVVFTDVLPAGVQFTQWITQSGATISGNEITWSAATLPANGAVTIAFQANVTAAPRAIIVNRARASAANADPIEVVALFAVGNGGYKVTMPEVLK